MLSGYTGFQDDTHFFNNEAKERGGRKSTDSLTKATQQGHLTLPLPMKRIHLWCTAPAT